MRRTLGLVALAANWLGQGPGEAPGQDGRPPIRVEVKVEVRVVPNGPRPVEVHEVEADSVEVKQVEVQQGLVPQPVFQRADPDFDPSVARPSYARARPRVLFDEAHANFHTAGGRYAPFARMIASDGYVVAPSPDRFSPGVLAKGDILIVANAMIEGTSEIAEGEADAVRDWVRDGGSLLLITDLPAFSVASRPLAARFGVTMSLAQTGDPNNSLEHPANLVFSRENGLLGDHPILRGRNPSERVGRVVTYAGQSLRGPEGSIPLLRLGPGAVEPSNGAMVAAAGTSQGLAFPFGKGRVVVLGEAAVLSAQTVGGRRVGMNVPGTDNRQFGLNIMHWLSGLLEPGAGSP